jgi:hypothetical protein
MWRLVFLKAGSHRSCEDRTNPTLTLLSFHILTVLDSPRYLRVKGGASELYVAGIFKATKEENLLFSKYIKAVPDAVFISVRNCNVPLAKARIIISMF